MTAVNITQRRQTMDGRSDPAISAQPSDRETDLNQLDQQLSMIVHGIDASLNRADGICARLYGPAPDPQGDPDLKEVGPSGMIDKLRGQLNTLSDQAERLSNYLHRIENAV